MRLLLLLALLCAVMFPQSTAIEPTGEVERAGAAQMGISTLQDSIRLHPDAVELSATVGGGNGNSVESASISGGYIFLRHGSLSKGGEVPSGVNKSFGLAAFKLAERCPVDVNTDADGNVAGGAELHLLVEDGVAVAVWSE